MLNVSDIYSAHLDKVFSYFVYRVSTISDAEDLTSATFERVVRHAAKYDPERGDITTWLFSIAERQLIDHYRRSGRRDERPFDEVSEAAHSEGDRPSIGLDPALERAIGQLSDRDRQVLALRFGGDLSGNEIAMILHLSEANVHQILSRSLRRLRAELATVIQGE